MNRRVSRHAAITPLSSVVLALVFLAAPAGAGTADSSAIELNVTPGPGSALWFEGTSNLHDFECHSTEVEITLAGNPAAGQPSGVAGLESLIRSSGIRRVDVRVPVSSLHSKKEGLDKNMRKAMRAEEFPDVRFRLQSYEVMPGGGAGDTIGIRAHGLLTISGREREIDLEGRASKASAGLWLEGSKALVMSDYGIRPPTIMMGTLRVSDHVTVRYRLLLVPRGEDVAPSSKQ